METIPQEKVKRASEGLRAIAHPLRLSVLCHLMRGDLCVHELMEATGSNQSNLSQHLSRMRMMGIIENEKRGQQVFYRIADPQWGEMVHLLQHIYCPEMCKEEQ